MEAKAIAKQAKKDQWKDQGQEKERARRAALDDMKFNNPVLYDDLRRQAAVDLGNLKRGEGLKIGHAIMDKIVWTGQS